MENQTESRWEKFKKNIGTDSEAAKPWHLINPNLRIAAATAEQRLTICKSCEKFILPTNQCRECGCIMTMKTKLTNASCPLAKW